MAKKIKIIFLVVGIIITVTFIISSRSNSELKKGDNVKIQKTENAVQTENSVVDSKTDKENCESAGGKWSARPLSEIGVCNMPTTTAGKECLDESECDGSCIAESENATKGKCSEWTVVLGCRYHMKSGSAVSVCSD